MKQNKILIAGVSAFGLSAMVLPAQIQITSFSQEVSATADDLNATSESSVDNLTTLAAADAAVDATDGTVTILADSFAAIEYTTAIDFPTQNNTQQVDGFELIFSGEVSAFVDGAATVGSTANASASVQFSIEVVGGSYEFFFSNTGSDSDLRYTVGGFAATNAEQSFVAGPGTYVVNFIDGAQASADGNNTDSEQFNDQSYSLRVVAVPEPSSTALLGLGGLALLARRKRA